VGRPVAGPVEGHDTEVASEEVNLHLPEVLVDDGPGRQQEDRRFALSLDLVVDLDPVVLHEAVQIGFTRSHPTSSLGRLS
jgi:hypothetical protein